MGDERVAAPDGRRRLLKGIIAGVTGVMGGGLAAVLGAFAASPVGTGRTPRWIRAASLKDLEPGTPQPLVVAVPKASGWHRTRTRQIVYVTWDGAQNVRALSATCTHLGCNVAWDKDARQFRCPCHGGTYNEAGHVVAGPPPHALVPVQARVDITSGEPTLMVEL
jgi:Rieske Fe-S protein